MDFLLHKTFLVQLLANKAHHTETLRAGHYALGIEHELVLQDVSEIQGIKAFNNNEEVLHSKTRDLMFC